MLSNRIIVLLILFSVVSPIMLNAQCDDKVHQVIDDIYDLPGGPRTDFGLGAAYDIRVSDGNIITVGVATRDSSYNDGYTSACYWLNGNLYYLVNESGFNSELETDWYRSNAKGVFID